MKFTKAFLVSIFCLGSIANYAQEENETLIAFDNQENVTKKEFKRLYLKNNSKQAENKSSVEEYLDLFIDFKLKVKEAEARGLDTAASFIKELKGYRRQLAQPYLSAEGVIEKLKKEAYDRMQEEIKVSHILIAVDKNASPEDTLKAYKEAKKVKQLLGEGSDFTRTAMSYSDDKSVKTNKGDLGYFTVFQMVYPFETTAYNTEEGVISDIVRSQYGYHILKVTDRRKANGKVKAAHILVSSNPQITNTSNPEEKINEIYNRLESGESFEVLAKQFSDDNQSARVGGELPVFGVNQMVPEFEEVVFSLEKGKYSKPFKTQYGWHIAKLINKEGIPPYKDIESGIEADVKKDSRSKLAKGAIVTKIKNQYSFKENENELKDFYKVVDSTFLNANWKVEQAKKLHKTMFSIGTKDVNQQDFANYLADKQRKRKKLNLEVLINKMYKNFVKEKLLDYKDKQLEKEEPEFKALVKEYHDGILLFNLTDEMVWSKAIKDTTALKAFFEKNKQNYKWGERVNAVVYSAKNDEIANEAIQLVQKGKSTEEVAKGINNKSHLNLKYEEDKYEKGDNAVVDQVKWNAGISQKVKKDDRVYFVNIKEVLEPADKKLSEARGIVISDFQNQLENEWVKNLRAKYDYKVNKSVLKELKKELN